MDSKRWVFSPELESWLAQRGERAFRAGQIRRWVLERKVAHFEKMTDLPKGLREALEQEWTVLQSRVARESRDVDGTFKLLLELVDKRTIECVLIAEASRRTVCLSTQVGCGMGCVFCASGLAGLERNLTTDEMIDQLLQVHTRLEPDERIDHIVVMGMGEPMANLEALLPALAFATAQEGGLGISARNVTISTVGLPAKIRKLADSGRPYHLAVSLHAPDDVLRRQIVPMAEKVRLTDIIGAADEFRSKTGRQVTFEYVLLAGVNDADDQARRLGRLLAGRDAMINLIPFNLVSGLPYQTPSPQRTASFSEILRRSGLTVKVRKRKGAAIDAACGQLRRSHEVALDSKPLGRLAIVSEDSVP